LIRAAADAVASSGVRAIRGRGRVRYRGGYTVRAIARHLVLLAATLTVILPFVWIVSASLKTLPEFFHRPPTFLPNAPTLDNYIFVFNGLPMVWKFYLNSVIVTSTSVTITVIVATLAGYGFARLEFPYRELIFWMMLLSLYFPTQITSVFAIFELTSWMNLQDTHLGLILPYIGSLHLPMHIFIMRTVFREIPRELEEAAALDGASPLLTFRKVMLPLAYPGVVVITILSFAFIWGEYLLARTLTVDNAMTIAVGLTGVQTGMGTTEFPVIAAAYFGAIVPPIVLFIILQRWFMKGLTAGAIKL
jgi:ABC-type glycerol-3-phosphate transport system permease component